MKNESLLAADEQLRWEGRPAPRCYTFRHWRHSIFGLIFLGICSYWQILGVQMAGTYAIFWLAWLPVPFVLLGVYFFVGHLLQARLEWNNVYYAITDRRLIVQRGIMKRRIESMPLAAVTYLSLHDQGDQLGTLRVSQGKEMQLTLHCLEYPRKAVVLLEEAIKRQSSREIGQADSIASAGR